MRTLNYSNRNKYIGYVCNKSMQLLKDFYCAYNYARFNLISITSTKDFNTYTKTVEYRPSALN